MEELNHYPLTEDAVASAHEGLEKWIQQLELFNNLEKGMPLVTGNSERFGNAVVLKVEEGLVTFLTDFGNICELSLEEAKLYFQVPRWYIESKAIGYPFESVEERIDTQIELLQKAKEFLSNDQI